MALQMAVSCDLLRNSYLWRVINNRKEGKDWSCAVVICLEILTFEGWLTTGCGYLAHILLFIMKNRIKNLVRKVLIVLAVKGLLSPWFREILQCWQIVCRWCTSWLHAQTWEENFWLVWCVPPHYPCWHNAAHRWKTGTCWIHPFAAVFERAHIPVCLSWSLLADQRIQVPT